MHLNLPVAKYHTLIGTYLRPQRARVVALAFLLLASICLQLLNPQIIREFIDTASSGSPGNTLLLAATMFIVVGFVQSGLNLLAHYVSLNVSWSATNALRTDLTVHLLRLDMPFHKTHTPGELIERVDGDVTALANLFSEFTIRIAANFLLVLAVLVLLFGEDWRAGLGLSVYITVTLLALVALQNFGTRRWAASRSGRCRAVRLHRGTHLRHGRHTGSGSAGLRAAWPAHSVARGVAARSGRFDGRQP